MSNTSSPSLLRYIITGFLIFSLPLIVIFYQLSRLNNGTLLRVPLIVSEVDMDGIVPKAVLTTPLNLISNENVIGGNHFLIGTQVFVFLSPGPGNIWYPYAVTKRPPEDGCKDNECLVLSGHIQAVSDNSLGIRYSYENFVAETPLLKKISQADDDNMEVTLSVGRNGHAIVHSLHFGVETIDQRKRLIPTLSGFSHKGDRIIPTK